MKSMNKENLLLIKLFNGLIRAGVFFAGVVVLIFCYWGQLWFLNWAFPSSIGEWSYIERLGLLACILAWLWYCARAK